MSDDPPNQREQGDAGQQMGERKRRSIEGLKTKRRAGKQILFAALGGVCYSAAYSLHKWQSIPLAASGIIFLSIALRLELEGRAFAKPKPRNMAAAFGVVALVAWLVVFIAQQEPEPPKPHFRISLLVEGFSDSLQLTNSFLEFTGERNQLTTLPLGTIIIPKSSPQTNTELKFIVHNNSAALAENVAFSVSIDPKLKCVPDSGWLRSDFGAAVYENNSSGERETNRMESWIYHIPFALFPSNGAAMTSLRLPQSPFAKRFTFSTMTRGRGSQPTRLAFSLFFVPTNATTLPHVVLGTNDGSRIKMTFPIRK